MARVKVCRLCGHQNGSDELFCTQPRTAAPRWPTLAWSTAARWTRRRRGPPAAPRVEGDRSGGGGEGPPSQAADASRPSLGADAGRPVQAADAGRATMRDGGTAGAAPCALVFPWGRVPVAGRLGVGREEGFSPISGRLDAFSTVSRRHAVVGAAEGRWTVQDLGSTNGTYVNDRRLAAGETRPIQNGDQVGFSRGLQVQVEIGAEPEGAGSAPDR